LVRDRSDIVYAHAAGALGAVQILPAPLDAAYRSAGAVIVRVRQLAPALLMRGEPVRIGIAMQVAAEDSLRLFPFGDLDRFHVLLFAEPRVEADEVHEAGSLQQ